MKKVAFLIGTEYHLIVSLDIINKFYKENYEIKIFRDYPDHSKRLKYVSVGGDNIDYKEIKYNEANPSPIVKKNLDEIIEFAPEIFYFFLEIHPYLNYLLYGLHRKHTKIVLAPDGLKVYNNYKISAKKRLLSFIRGIRFCYNARLLKKIPFVEKKYATSKYIDEIWAESPELILSCNEKKIVPYSVGYTKAFINSLNTVFGFDKINNSIEDGSILYLDTPLKNEEYFEITLELLRSIRDRYRNRKIYVKLHQHSDDKAKDYYSSIDNLFFLVSDYPAELYIANSSNLLLYSMISASFLFYNPSCKYYWLYPLYGNILDLSRFVCPVDYINIISDKRDLLI